MISLKNKFEELKEKNEKALVGFITAGDPTPEISIDIVIAMAESGVDIIELGIPFSDPTADGPVIQKSSERAIKAGTNLEKVFEMIKKIREKTHVPLVLFSYYNPVFKFGEKKFCEKSIECGANGVLIVDLPFEEKSLIKDFDREKFPKINLLAPTTTDERLEKISKNSNGFIYLVSKTGITGSAGLDPELTKKDFLRIRKHTNTPVCIGFGVKTNEDVKNIAKFADGVVIGSAFESLIEENLKNKNLVEVIGKRAGEYKKQTLF
ncbi:MAG: tryptophan synthase subunit alpha [Desulforegulaceae bacterium]|nr:tryptophan synthase subunit alpha [Desulforegulaceae bacterium]